VKNKLPAEMTLEELEREQLSLMSVMAEWMVEHDRLQPQVERLMKLMEKTTEQLAVVQTEMIERMKERHR
jgi:hypothetical protein